MASFLLPALMGNHGLQSAVGVEWPARPWPSGAPTSGSKAIHEFGEAYLCKREGIKFKDIDKFDIDHPELDDPGSSPKAPYHKQHMLMLIIEKLLCRSMGLSWKMYEKRLAEVCV